MTYQIIKKLPNAEEIIATLPLSKNGYSSIEQHKHEIRAILAGRDPRLLMIVGPCSAWPAAAVLEYARRLQEINQQVKDQLKLIMRVYIQKPRTVKGWTGPINQPDPLATPDIEAGIWYCRKLMTQVIEMGLPIADECLFTHNARGFQELLSWVAIGARSTEDQEHRIFASSLDCPVGMKNPTHGSLKIAVNSIIAAQHSHYAVFDGYEVKTAGNQFAHLVLRGSHEQPNYSLNHLQQVANLFETGEVANPAAIIDVSHDNCLVNGIKDYNAQAQIVMEVMKSIKPNPSLKKLVKGFMLESFIKAGRQNLDSGTEIDSGGLSITDPCLSWEATAQLLVSVANWLRSDKE